MHLIMSKCNMQALLTSGSVMGAAMSPGQVPLLRLALLTAILQKNQPSFTPNKATIDSLLANGKCFHCLSAGEKKLVKLQLLCNIVGGIS